MIFVVIVLVLVIMWIVRREHLLYQRQQETIQKLSRIIDSLLEEIQTIDTNTTEEDV